MAQILTILDRDFRFLYLSATWKGQPPPEYFVGGRPWDWVEDEAKADQLRRRFLLLLLPDCDEIAFSDTWSDAKTLQDVLYFGHALSVFRGGVGAIYYVWKFPFGLSTLTMRQLMIFRALGRGEQVNSKCRAAGPVASGE